MFSISLSRLILSVETREKTAEALVKSGVNNVLLSVGAFHQSRIPLPPARAFAKALQRAGVGRLSLQPAWLLHSNSPYQCTRTAPGDRENEALSIGNISPSTFTRIPRQAMVADRQLTTRAPGIFIILPVISFSS